MSMREIHALFGRASAINFDNVGRRLSDPVTNRLQNASTSIYCTAFIAWKVWRTSRAVKETGDEPRMSVLAILVEGAAMWIHLPNIHASALVVFFAVSYQTGSVPQSLTAQLTPPIIGLANMFIHLRVGLTWSRTPEPDGSVPPMTSSASMVQMASQ
ncbi:hypothetical protein B0H19DRAFT_1085475 [Mycena capillaripes]|nr:hypothetical protein B0H19DRAFT_1085475 [Mycena capillaripes]